MRPCGRLCGMRAAGTQHACVLDLFTSERTRRITCNLSLQFGGWHVPMPHVTIRHAWQGVKAHKRAVLQPHVIDVPACCETGVNHCAAHPPRAVFPPPVPVPP